MESLIITHKNKTYLKCIKYVNEKINISLLSGQFLNHINDVK